MILYFSHPPPRSLPPQTLSLPDGSQNGSAGDALETSLSPLPTPTLDQVSSVDLFPNLLYSIPLPRSRLYPPEHEQNVKRHYLNSLKPFYSYRLVPAQFILFDLDLSTSVSFPSSAQVRAQRRSLGLPWHQQKKTFYLGALAPLVVVPFSFSLLAEAGQYQLVNTFKKGFHIRLSLQPREETKMELTEFLSRRTKSVFPPEHAAAFLPHLHTRDDCPQSLDPLQAS